MRHAVAETAEQMMANVKLRKTTSATCTDLLLLLLYVVPRDLQADGGRRGRGHRLLPPLRRGGGEGMILT